MICVHNFGLVRAVAIYKAENELSYLYSSLNCASCGHLLNPAVVMMLLPHLDVFVVDQFPNTVTTETK